MAPERAALPAPPLEDVKRKPKGPKGPNPLSMKKKIPKPDLTAKPKAKPQKEDTAIVGQKRKQPSDEGDEGEERVGSKKKKRRRKVVGVVEEEL